jgi:hypothetical protein
LYLGRDIIGWRHSKTTHEALCGQLVVWQFTPAINESLAGDDPVLHKTNSEHHMEMKREVEEQKLHRVAKIHDFLEMGQGSHNLQATQKESRARNKQITAVVYIPDTEEIVKAYWSNFQHDGVAALKLSERSRVPPALCT